MTKLATPPPESQALPLAAGVSFYQVLEPPKILAPQGGAHNYAMFGPFPDLASATQFANNRPGALIMLNLVLHQNPAVIAGQISPAA